MKILVTGHLGYIGSHLMKKLEAVGIDIKEGNDILDCELPDVDVVIHLAAQPGVVQSMIDPTETVRTNTLGTVRLAEKYKNTKFIFASTGGAIQDEILSPYGLSNDWPKGSYYFGSNENYTILELAKATGKPIALAPSRKGELLHSSLKNTTPDWKPITNVIDYIHASA